MFLGALKLYCGSEGKCSNYDSRQIVSVNGRLQGGYLGTELTCLSQCGMEYFVRECLELFLFAYSKEMRV